jgi:hypothetical protein
MLRLWLGSNKRCGVEKKMKRPPCLWAHSDSAIVSKCFRIAAEKRAEQKAKEKEEEELRQRYEDGTFNPNFQEPIHAVDEAAHQRREEVNERSDDDGDDEFSLRNTPPPKPKETRR